MATIEYRQAQRRQLRGLWVLGAPQSPRIPVRGRRGPNRDAWSPPILPLWAAKRAMWGARAPIRASLVLWLDATRCLSVANSRRPSLIVSLAHRVGKDGSRRQVCRDSRRTDFLARQAWTSDWLHEREAPPWLDEILLAHQSPGRRQFGSVRRQRRKRLPEADFRAPCPIALKLPRSRRLAQEQHKGTAVSSDGPKPPLPRPCALVLARVPARLHHPISYFFPTSDPLSSATRPL